MNIKAQLKLHLDERGMTPAELARKSGVSKQVLSSWLGGTKPKNIEQLKKVADSLNISIDHLAFGNGNEKAPPGPDGFDSSESGWIAGLFEVRIRRIKR